MITLSQNYAPVRHYAFENCTNIHNSILFDSSLSDSALGFLCRIRGWSKGCEISFSDLYIKYNRIKDKDKSRKNRKELVDCVGELIMLEYFCPYLIDSFDDEEGLMGRSRYRPLLSFLTEKAKNTIK